MLIGDAVLRSNPRYRLVLLDRLGQEERLLAEGGGETGEPYGVLTPADGSGLEPRSVSTDTALLLFTLQQPGRCPEYVRRGLGDRLEPALGRLIMDGILEVEVDGAFRTGWSGWAPFAHEWARSADAATPAAARTNQLSVDALRHGQALLALADLPVELVATRLYMYGRQPVTPRLRRTLSSDEAVARFLGIRSSRLATSLRAGWRQDGATRSSPWRSWSPKRSAGRRPRSLTYKLYVSPTVDDLPEACSAVAAGLADARGIVGFKVARSVEGLARPDKMVAYFESLDALHDGATRVREGAAACEPHGVPFTAAVTNDGLLSWAIDPPRGRGSGAGDPVSWRSWITGRLAEHLVAGRGGSSDDAEPWQVALARVRLDGVDPTTWVPGPGIFDRQVAAGTP